MPPREHTNRSLCKQPVTLINIQWFASRHSGGTRSLLCRLQRCMRSFFFHQQDPFHLLILITITFTHISDMSLYLPSSVPPSLLFARPTFMFPSSFACHPPGHSASIYLPLVAGVLLAVTTGVASPQCHSFRRTVITVAGWSCLVC